MNVLITGANGFVGGVLCDRILSHYPQINTVFAVSRRSINLSLSSPKLQSVTVSSLDDLVASNNHLEKIDCIIHLAARVHKMQDSSEDPLSEFRAVNTEATCKLAKAAARTGVRRFIFLSSIKVNGEGGYNETYTESSLAHPTDPYGISKWEAEQQLMQISAQTGLEVVIIRPPLVYGPGVKANFQQMLRVINQGIPLPIGAVKNQRSFVYVGNLADAIITAAMYPAAINQTFLVSDGQDVSTPQLTRLIAAALGCSPRLVPIPEICLNLLGKITGRSKQISRLTSSLTIDSQKFCKTFQWEPPFTLEQGLETTAQWFKHHFPTNTP